MRAESLSQTNNLLGGFPSLGPSGGPLQLSCQARSAPMAGNGATGRSLFPRLTHGFTQGWYQYRRRRCILPGSRRPHIGRKRREHSSCGSGLTVFHDGLEPGQAVSARWKLLILIDIDANDEVQRHVPAVDSFVLAMIEERALIFRS